MNNHLSNWEKDLQSRLADHEVTPPAMGWERLQKALEAKATASSDASGNTLEAKETVSVHKVKNKARRPLFTLLITTATAAAACLIVALLPHSSSDNLSVGKSTLAQQSEPAVSAPSPTNETKNCDAHTSHRSTASQPLHAQIAQQLEQLNNQAETKTQNTLAAISNTTPNTTEGLGNTNIPTPTTPTANADTLSSTRRLLAEDSPSTSSSVSPSLSASRSKQEADKAERMATYQALMQKKHHDDKHSLSLALMASTHLGGSSSQLGYLPLAASSSTSNNLPTYEENDVEKSEGMPTVMGANLNQYVNTKAHHKMPVQIGLNLNIPLSNRWGLTTGLTYTRLNSDTQSGTPTAYYTTEQTLHYVGIPLQLNYTILNTRYVGLYVGAGAAVEKCVKGVQRTEYVVESNYHATTPEVHNLGRGLWQASLGATAGFELHITSQVGLYVEPGVRYYLPDGSSLPNIRHDKPFNFSLQTGLRFSPFK